MTAFSYYRKLSFDRAKCGASNLSSFPALINIADTTFGSRVNSTNGFDIVFSTDQAGASLIPWEIEFFDKPTGTLIAWVNVTTLNGSAAGTNSFVYMCYGNSGVTSSQNTGPNAPAMVWNSGYGGVWHMGNGTALSGNDSTANANNASALNGCNAVAGKVDGGAGFNGTSNVISIPHSPSVSLANTMTLSCWANNTTAVLSEYLIKWVSGNYYYLRSNVSNQYQFSIAQAQDGKCSYTPGTSYIGAWHYVVGVYDGNAMKLYVDGILRANAAIGSVSADVNTGPLGLGAIVGIGQWYNGLMDEARLSNIGRSADWILTEYNNQNAPGNIGADNFVIFGPETAAQPQQPMAVIL